MGLPQIGSQIVSARKKLQNYLSNLIKGQISALPIENDINKILKSLSEEARKVYEKDSNPGKTIINILRLIWLLEHNADPNEKERIIDKILAGTKLWQGQTQFGGGTAESSVDIIHNATRDVYTMAIEFKDLQIKHIKSLMHGGASPQEVIIDSIKQQYDSSVEMKNAELESLRKERDKLTTNLKALESDFKQSQSDMTGFAIQVEQLQTQLKQQSKPTVIDLNARDGLQGLGAVRAASAARAEQLAANRRRMRGQRGGAYTSARGPEELPNILEEQDAWNKVNDAYNSLEPEYKTLLPPPEPAPLSSLATPFQNYINNEADPEALEEARDALGMVPPEEIDNYINNTEYENEAQGNSVSQRVTPMYQSALPRVKPEWVTIMIRADILQQLLQNKMATVDGIRQV